MIKKSFFSLYLTRAGWLLSDALILIVMSGFILTTSAQNLVPNGSVEEGEGETPDWFYRDPTWGDYAVWADDHAFSGSHSLFLQSGLAGEAQWWAEGWPVDGEGNYRFSTMVRQENLNVNPLNDDHRWAMIIRFGTGVDGNGHLTGIIPPDHYTWLDQSVPSWEWYELSASFEAPVEATYADWNLRKRTSALGQVWADDIACYRISDEITTGEVAVTAVVNGLSVMANYEGDADQDGSATLHYRQSGQVEWIEAGDMVRAMGSFVGSVDELDPQQAYDIQVTFSDPDGVEGENPRIVTDVFPGQDGDVSLVEAGANYALLSTGGYLVEYDAAETDNFVMIYREGSGDNVLITPLLQMGDFSPTDPDHLVSFTVTDEEDFIRINMSSEYGSLDIETELSCPRQSPGLILWTVSVISTADFDPPAQVEYPVLFYDRAMSCLVNADANLLADQLPYAAPACYLVEPDHVQGTAFYFEDLTPLNPYYEATGIGPSENVHGSGMGFGYRRPDSELLLESGVRYNLTSACLLLTPGFPQGETETMSRYLEGLAEVWPYLEKPTSEEIDWDEIAIQEIVGIQSQSCWTTVNGHDLLRAYVGSPVLDGAEAITQLDVLVALRNYRLNHTNPQAFALDLTLSATLELFYNEQHETFVNNFPNDGITGGNSWYTVQLHLDLARLALYGDETARDLLENSIDQVIDLAHNCEYRFPVFFQYEGNIPGAGNQHDVSGAYSLLMIMCYSLFGDLTYSEEALVAAETLRGHGFDLTHEAHVTAATAVGCAHLFCLTGDQEYLELSWIPLANLLRMAWLWECDYGWATDYGTFCGFSAMPMIGYIAAKEQHEIWRYLNEYLYMAGDMLDPSLEELLTGIIEFAEVPVRSSLPPFLPPDAIATAQWGVTDPQLNIPLEDLVDGFRQSGQVGQELYGAGAPLTLAAGYVNEVPETEETDKRARPEQIRIEKVYPNPSNMSALAVINIPIHGGFTPVRIEIFNLLGRRVALLHYGIIAPGERIVHWNGKSDGGVPVSSGTYILRINSDGNQLARKIIIQK